MVKYTLIHNYWFNGPFCALKPKNIAQNDQKQIFLLFWEKKFVRKHFGRNGVS
jgi:hypothetical protein